MPTILIIGGTRGLGRALVEYYATGSDNQVYATSRAGEPPSSPSAPNIHWVTSVDLSAGPDFSHLTGGIDADKIDTVIITAGFFETEDFGASKWDEQIKMYTLSSVAPVFVVESLVKSSKVSTGSKIIIVSSESGSITLRHEQEGGGNFGHHGSKAASNMVGKQLAFDLKPKGIAIGIVHPSFMRTEMTARIGFDKFWDDGGALKPEEAAGILADWVNKEFTIDKTGSYWAPRGTRDIGNWDVVMGKETARNGPVELPW